MRATTVVSQRRRFATSDAAIEGAIPRKTASLVHLRVSQINGCSVCIEINGRLVKPEDETDERLLLVAAWRDALHFTPPERAALALAEAVTRMADRSDPVPDEVWAEAAKHYDEKALAALLISISSTNVWNRLNVATRQLAGNR